MKRTQIYLLAGLLTCVAVMAGIAPAQTSGTSAQPQAPPLQAAKATPVTLGPQPVISPDPAPSAPVPALFDLSDSNVKFSLDRLTSTLRDGRHEGWVLSAYPDPKTSRPLIGAGFGLDVEATEHIQHDALNPHPFVEPSSAQLWQAAGLDPLKLQAILEQYDHDLAVWKKKNFRRKTRNHSLKPEVTDDEAMSLLRISATQAVFNARAYCRQFDRLTASQQMALSQLVFQMGVNLEEFTAFLAAINEDPPQTGDDAAHWKAVQNSLIQSQWARHYRVRAISVIAMFDPDYAENPRAAERKVEAVLRPPAHHRKKSRRSSHAA